MEMKNYFRSIVIAGAILAGVVSHNYNQPTKIETGKLSYSTENLQSDNYADCSALILDSGDSAVMAHAIPSDNIEYWDPRLSKTQVFSHNAVDKALAEIISKGIRTSNIDTIVIAGERKGLKRILKDLRKHNLHIWYANLADKTKGHLRDLKYNPKTNSLEIEYHD